MLKKRYDSLLKRELIENVYKTIPFSVVINILTAIIVTIVYWPLSNHTITVWFILVVIVMAYRVGTYIYYKARKERIHTKKAWLMLWTGMFLSAIVWVSNLWYFAGRHGIAYDFFMAFVMGGLAAGAVTTLSSDRVINMTYITIILGGTSIWLVLSKEPIEVMMGGLVMAFLAFLMLSSAKIYDTVVDSLTFKKKNLKFIDALKARKAEMELIFDNVPVGIFFYNTELRIINVNSYFIEIFGSSRESIIGLSLESLKDRRILPAMRMPLESHGQKDGYYEGHYHTTTSDIDVHIRVKTTALKSPNGRLIGAIGIVEDIAKELENKEKIELFAQFYTQNPNPVFRVKCHFEEILLENRAAKEIRSFMKKYQYDKWKEFLKSVCKMERKSLMLDVGKTTFQFDVVFANDDEFNLYGRDVTKELAAKKRADYLAYYDELTGLPRRKLLFEHIKIAMERSKRNGTKNALLFLDLDNFKQINDSMGHDIGDILLEKLAKRLTSIVRTGDIIARLGGDEFVVLLADLQSGMDKAALKSEMIALKIKDQVAKPFYINGRKLYFGVSIGITLFDYDKDPFVLLKEADVALYEAKALGRNCVKIFDEELQERTMDKTDLIQDLHIALQQNQLKIFYQPQIEIVSGRCIGAEALLRWEHPTRGEILPQKFIPIAEESGSIHELGQWVLKSVAIDCADLDLGYIAVNISAKEFLRSDFIDGIEDMVRRGDIDAKKIELEITESIFLDNYDKVNDKLNRLKKMGFKFSIDDFGTGYSSLSYLKNISIDALKIDRRFVEDIGINQSNEALTMTIIDIASHFGLKTVAEGVESKEQLNFLKKFGCDIAQGYYFGKPMSITDFRSWLSKL